MKVAVVFSCLLFACGSDVQLGANVFLSNALTAAEVREITLRAVAESDVQSLGMTPEDLCQRYVQRLSYPDLIGPGGKEIVYRQNFDLPSGLAGGEKRSIDRLPTNLDYVLLVEASNQKEIDPQSGSRGPGAEIARGCTPGIPVKPNTTTSANVCLYYMDAMGLLIGPPNCPR